MRTGSLKGSRLKRAGGPFGLEATVTGLGQAIECRGRPGSSGLWRRDQVCLRDRDVDGRECGRIARLGDVEGSRARYIGGLHRRGGPHVLLVPSICGCSLSECSKSGQLQLGRQSPVL